MFRYVLGAQMIFTREILSRLIQDRWHERGNGLIVIQNETTSPVPFLQGKRHSTRRASIRAPGHQRTGSLADLARYNSTQPRPSFQRCTT